MGESGDGGAVRAPVGGAPCTLRRTPLGFAGCGWRDGPYKNPDSRRIRKGLDCSKPLKFWRARQDLNPRPPGS